MRRAIRCFVLVTGLALSWAAGAAETITLATTAWPPHYTPEVEGDGYFSEISREAFRRGGYELEIAFVPWKRAVDGGKKGYYDGVLGIILTPERARYFEYSIPVKETELLLIARKDSNLPDTYSSYQELIGYTVGVTRGYFLPKEFEEAGFNINIADRDELNLLKLLKRRVDLIADYGDAVYYFINTKYPEYKGAIKTLSPPIDVVAMHNTISKKRARSEEIVAAFDRGLESMKEDGTFDAILRKHGILPVE